MLLLSSVYTARAIEDPATVCGFPTEKRDGLPRPPRPQLACVFTAESAEPKSSAAGTDPSRTTQAQAPRPSASVLAWLWLQGLLLSMLGALLTFIPSVSFPFLEFMLFGELHFLDTALQR